VENVTNSLWQEAKFAEEANELEDAEALYSQILLHSPKDQQAALRMAICQQKAGEVGKSLASFDRAIAIDDGGYWAEVAVYYRAEVCLEAGLNEEALKGIQQLRANYPDSSYNARARVIESRITGRNEAISEAILERELHAGAIYDEGMQFARENDNTRAIQKMEDVLALYPDCAVALRALEAKGHLLLREKQYEDAMNPFIEILAQTRETCPTARITLEAKTRLAAILHVLKRREEAIDQYIDILQSSGDPEIEANAALQTAGLAFEICQRRRVDEGPLPDQTWKELRGLCENVKNLPGVSESQKVRADLMLAEIYTWQEDREKTIDAAEEFLEEYDAKLYRTETATMHLLAGQALRHLKRYNEALEHLRWIADEYADEDCIWPDMDHLPKTYFYIWQILRDQGAPKSEVKEAGLALQSRFPDSPFSEHVRLMNKQKGWRD